MLLCLNCLHSLRERGRLLLVLLKRMFGMAARLVWSRTSKVLIRKSKLQLLCLRSTKEVVHQKCILLLFIKFSLSLCSKSVWYSFICRTQNMIILKNVSTVFVHKMKVNGVENNIVHHWLSLYGKDFFFSFFHNLFWGHTVLEQHEGGKWLQNTFFLVNYAFKNQTIKEC